MIFLDNKVELNDFTKTTVESTYISGEVEWIQDKSSIKTKPNDSSENSTSQPTDGNHSFRKSWKLINMNLKLSEENQDFYTEMDEKTLNLELKTPFSRRDVLTTTLDP